jgi:cytochrome c oxidase subunit 4
MEDESVYTPVFVSLLILTGLTIGLANLGIGRIVAIVVALSIAAMKAGLIASYFMHLRFEKPLIFGIIGVGLIMVGILAVGIMPDLAFRW